MSIVFNALEGERLIFKPLSIEDAPRIHSYASNKDVSRYIGWELKQNLKETQDYIEEMLQREAAGTHLYASIVEKETQTIMGTGMLFNFSQDPKQCEIGYVFHQEAWGKGFGTESVKLITQYAFDVLKCHKVHARVVGVNRGSARILEKNRYQLEGTVRDYYCIEGEYSDGLLYGRLLSD